LSGALGIACLDLHGLLTVLDASLQQINSKALAILRARTGASFSIEVLRSKKPEEEIFCTVHLVPFKVRRATQLCVDDLVGSCWRLLSNSSSCQKRESKLNNEAGMYCTEITPKYIQFSMFPSSIAIKIYISYLSIPELITRKRRFYTFSPVGSLFSRDITAEGF